jgi:predicted aconitase with swiveling domain
MRASERLSGTTLVAGAARGRTVKLTEPLNAWGGLDPETGVIVHHSHPQRGVCLANRILVMQESRGSGTNAQVFAQAWANGNGPLAVLLAVPDYVLCAGAVVSQELYDVTCPVVVLDAGDYDQLADGDLVTIAADDHQATVDVGVDGGYDND